MSGEKLGELLRDALVILGTVQEKLAAGSDELERAVAGRAEAEARAAETDKTLAEVLSELEDTQTALAKAKAAADGLTRERDEANAELAAAHASQDAAEKARDEAEQALGAARAEVDKLTTEAERSAAAHDEDQEVARSKLKDMEQQLDTAQSEARLRGEQLQEKAEGAERRSRELAAELDQLKERHTTQTGRLNADVDAARRERDEALERLKQRERKLEKIASQLLGRSDAPPTSDPRPAATAPSRPPDPRSPEAPARPSSKPPAPSRPPHDSASRSRPPSDPPSPSNQGRQRSAGAYGVIDDSWAGGASRASKPNSSVPPTDPPRRQQPTPRGEDARDEDLRRRMSPTPSAAIRAPSPGRYSAAADSESVAVKRRQRRTHDTPVVPPQVPDSSDGSSADASARSPGSSADASSHPSGRKGR